MQSFPTSIPNYPDTSGSETLNAAGGGYGLSRILDDYGLDIKGVSTKVGTGASTPSAGKVLRGNGVGTSIWGAVDLTTDITGTMPTANGGTGTTTLTFPSGTDTLVGRATTDILTNKTLTNPTVTIDTISEHTSSNGITIDNLNIKDGKLNTNDSVVTSNITDGSVTNAKLATGAGQPGGAWTSWTPDLSSANLSGGTITHAKYTQIGKTVIVRFKYTMGGAGVDGGVTIPFPVDPATQDSNSPCGTAVFRDVSGNFNNGSVLIGAKGMSIYADSVSGARIVPVALSSTVPFTWATGDYLTIEATYEVA